MKDKPPKLPPQKFELGSRPTKHQKRLLFSTQDITIFELYCRLTDIEECQRNQESKLNTLIGMQIFALAGIIFAIFN